MRNKLYVILALGLAAVSAFSADSKSMTLEEAERQLAGVSQLDTSASFWVWATNNNRRTGEPDYLFRAGDQITIRATMKPNNDIYPYTVVAYRQYNKTGVKTYLPGNTTAVTDIFGRTIEQGFQITKLPEWNKQILVGAGGALVSTSVAVPNELGMHTIVVQIRDYTGTRILKSAYWKLAVVSEVENLPVNITSSRTLTSDKAYRIAGVTRVRGNAVLTIDPGTIIVGAPGSQPACVLLITTVGRLVANGTRSQPIIMTSSQPLGSRQRGDWGGLTLLGKARINDVSGSLPIEGVSDGDDGNYGGTDDGHDCGSLKYVRVEFAGALIRPNEESNSFTWGGCGTASKAEYLQAHYGFDDSFEWFGGINDAKYLVGTYGADDYVDVQLGYRGRVQHGVFFANSDRSNRGIESDNYERDFAARPLGNPTMYNFTFIGSNAAGFDESDSPCLYFRRGSGGSFNNMLCFNWTTRTFGGANIADSIQPNIAAGNFSATGILAWNNGTSAATPATNTFDSQVAADFRAHLTPAARQFVLANPLLRNPLEYSNPDVRGQIGSPIFRASWLQPPDDGFFDQWATWIGGMGDYDWTEEWTTFILEVDLRP
ncbi:MAG: hypothetical protein FJW36_16870 [Acidobacteria bacterium]|nr:hypothetical protein [Acidobacteriota bacterium]